MRTYYFIKHKHHHLIIPSRPFAIFGYILLALPCVFGGVGFHVLLIGAHLGRVVGSRRGWVLQIKFRAIQTNVLSFHGHYSLSPCSVKKRR